MAYTQDEKSTGLDLLTTLATGDLLIVGDVSDSGNAKAITYQDFVTQVENDLDLSNIPGTIDLTTQTTGILPLSKGGTGSSLSDPGANKLWGWDDTDGSIGFWTLGSGLSYDHSTHTISATVTGSPYNVNADETVSTWWTYEVSLVGAPQGSPSTAGIPSGWQQDGAQPYMYIKNTITSTGGGAVYFAGSNTSARIYTLLGGVGSSNFFTFNSGKSVRIKFRAKDWGTGGTVINSLGLVTAASSIFANESSLLEGVRFLTHGNGATNTAYGVVADGANNSNGSLPSWTNTNWNLIEIVYTPSTVTFYVNGNADQIINTSIPTSATDVLLAIGSSGNTANPIFSSQITVSIEQ